MRRGKRAVRRLLRAALGLPLVLMLAGCWDRTDPEKMAWVTAVGVDKGPQNDYIFSFQLPAVPASVGGGGGGGTGGGGGGQSAGGRTAGPGDVFSMEAPDIITAMNASQGFIARQLTLAHAKVVIIGEDLARQDLSPILGAATRFQEFRRNITIMVARGPAERFLRLAQPRLEASTARWFELLQTTQAQAGIIPNTRMHEFLIAVESPGIGSLAALVATKPNAETDGVGNPPEAESTDAAPPTTGASTAGNVRRRGEIPVEIMGQGVFRGAHLVGFLTGDETRLVSMLRGDFRNASMAITDPRDPSKRFVLQLRPRGQRNLVVTRNGNQVRADFTVKLEATLLSIQSGANYITPQGLSQVEAAADKELASRMIAVLDKTLHSWGTDVFQIAGELRPTFATFPDWDRFNWADKAKNAKYSVKVDLVVRRYGLQVEPAVPRE